MGYKGSGIGFRQRRLANQSNGSAQWWRKDKKQLMDTNAARKEVCATKMCHVESVGGKVIFAWEKCAKIFVWINYKIIFS